MQAVKFAAAGFIVPFFFVYNPALLFSGPWIDIGRAVLTGTVGVIALAAGLEGYFIRGAALGARDLHRGRLLLIDPALSPTSSAWFCLVSRYCCRSCGLRNP